MSRRVKKEMKKMGDPNNEEFADVRAACKFHRGESPLKWNVLLQGPLGSHYEGSEYSVVLEFPATYPFRAPTVRFQPPIFHPNVEISSGEICKDALEDKWSPSLTVGHVCRILVNLLAHPNTDAPVNAAATKLILENPVAFRSAIISHDSRNGLSGKVSSEGKTTRCFSPSPENNHMDRGLIE